MSACARRGQARTKATSGSEEWVLQLEIQDVSNSTSCGKKPPEVSFRAKRGISLRKKPRGREIPRRSAPRNDTLEEFSANCEAVPYKTIRMRAKPLRRRLLRPRGSPCGGKAG